jgi:hypothetical protein
VRRFHEHCQRCCSRALATTTLAITDEEDSVAEQPRNGTIRAEGTVMPIRGVQK